MNGHFSQVDAMAEHCALALASGIETEYVRKLIEQRYLKPPPGMGHLEEWPWGLKVYTLGRFEIIKDSQPFPVHSRSQCKPLDLLKVLIASGGGPIRDEEISHVLWPDAGGDAGHSAFTTTLSRLRKIVGDEAVLAKGKRIGINPLHCWIDVLVLEEMFGHAAVGSSGAPSAAGSEMSKVLALYQGPFLAGEDDFPPVRRMRERQRLRFLQYIERAAWSLIGQKRYDEALSLYRRGLDADDLAEEFYRGIMKCSSALGRHAEGVRAYQQCAETLRDTLDIGPSNETEALYRALKYEKQSACGKARE